MKPIKYVVNVSIICSITSLLLISCTITPKQDAYLWLEDIDSQMSLDWVKQKNQLTAARLAGDPLYAELEKEALSVLNKKSRLPRIKQMGKWVYNLWRDENNPRGLYRRISLKDLLSNTLRWETVLDIDALSRAEHTPWVFKGMNCLAPDYIHCLLKLSPKGGDASEVREFNSQTLAFVDKGFALEQAKSTTQWLDENFILVATDFGGDTLTASGYPRTIKRWQRATPLAQATTLLTVAPTSVSVSGGRLSFGEGAEKQTIDLLVNQLTFWKRQYYQLIGNKTEPLSLPDTAVIEGMFDDKLVISLKENWQFKGITFAQGSVVIADPEALRDNSSSGKVSLLAQSEHSFVIKNVHVTPRGLVIVSLDDVRSRAYLYKPSRDTWRRQEIAFPQNGKITIETIDHNSGNFFARYEDFLTPPTLYHVDAGLAPAVVIAQASTFDSNRFTVEQSFATSKDGTQVPYFVVMDKSTILNGKNPTHMFSYGGFRISLMPSYSGSSEDLNGAYGKMWLERGGIFVLANIRGGAEYGPSWHTAALLDKRIKAYEDFEAVAEDLFARNITSAKHLGIEGRSNGGLMVGATMARRPELYAAVICGVPLLDMRRYHTLLAGSSWMAEYGDPSKPAHWAFISQYSPYQNISAQQQYPAIFFYTSTRDDRVHPGHARKMAAKMSAQGHRVDYYENLEGGHGGSVTNKQLARRLALGYTHLWRHLASTF